MPATRVPTNLRSERHAASIVLTEHPSFPSMASPPKPFYLPSRRPTNDRFHLSWRHPLKQSRICHNVIDGLKHLTHRTYRIPWGRRSHRAKPSDSAWSHDRERNCERLAQSLVPCIGLLSIKKTEITEVNVISPTEAAGPSIATS